MYIKNAIYFRYIRLSKLKISKRPDGKPASGNCDRRIRQSARTGRPPLSRGIKLARLPTSLLSLLPSFSHNATILVLATLGPSLSLHAPRLRPFYPSSGILDRPCHSWKFMRRAGSPDRPSNFRCCGPSATSTISDLPHIGRDTS